MVLIFSSSSTGQKWYAGRRGGEGGMVGRVIGED